MKRKAVLVKEREAISMKEVRESKGVKRKNPTARRKKTEKVKV